MARIKIGAVISDIRGSVAGMTFAGTSHGLVLKKKIVSQRPPSQRLRSIQGYMSMVISAWSAMSEDEKNVYNTYTQQYPSYARKTRTSPLIGVELFRRYNMNRLIAYEGTGSPLVTFTPAKYVYNSTAIGLSVSGSVVTFVSTPLFQDSDYIANVYISQAYDSASKAAGSRVRYLTGPRLVNTSVDLTATYTALNSVLPVAGQYIKVKFTVFLDTAPQLFAEETVVIQVT